MPKPFGSRPLNKIKLLQRDRPRCVGLLVLRARTSEDPYMYILQGLCTIWSSVKCLSAAAYYAVQKLGDEFRTACFFARAWRPEEAKRRVPKAVLTDVCNQATLMIDLVCYTSRTVPSFLVFSACEESCKERTDTILELVASFPFLCGSVTLGSNKQYSRLVEPHLNGDRHHLYWGAERTPIMENAQ